MWDGYPVERRKLTFGLDFDDTFSADPELWLFFIQLAEHRGHRVVCVTARHDIPENHAQLREYLPESVAIYCTSRKQKQQFMLDAGVEVDIWLDDDPIWIVGGQVNLDRIVEHRAYKYAGRWFDEVNLLRENNRAVHKENARLKNELQALRKQSGEHSEHS